MVAGLVFVHDVYLQEPAARSVAGLWRGHHSDLPTLCKEDRATLHLQCRLFLFWLPPLIVLLGKSKLGWTLGKKRPVALFKVLIAEAFQKQGCCLI